MAGIYMQSGIYSSDPGRGDFAYFGLDSNSEGWKRLDEHYKQLKAGTHKNPYIQKFYNERGNDQIYRGIVIECDEYYLNTLEKAYIYQGNSNIKNNPLGWNRSGGGEGAKKYEIPYSFLQGDTLHQGDDLLLFLKATGQNAIDPGGFVELLDGRRKDYEGYILY
jgi:hypothetical protein